MRAWIAVLLLACDKEPEPAPAPWNPHEPTRSNIVVIVLDEIGTDKIAAYGEHPDPPRTPELDRLASDGVLFRNAWAYASCTPTRVALLTGQHPAVWGAHKWLHPDDPWTLPPRAFTVPDLLALDPEQTWDHAFAGKWHVGSFQDPDPAGHPRAHGWNWYAGSLGNLDKYLGEQTRGPGNYLDWQKASDGEVQWTTKYATTDTVDDAIDRLAVLEEPWVLWVSLNAAHVPWTRPPAHLAEWPEGGSLVEQHDAVVEAMDTEVGRLVRALPEDSTVFVMGDNGTHGQAIAPPRDPTEGKGTLTEGGLNVALIVAGALVRSPGESAALVSAVDLFATLGDNAGVDPAQLPHPVHGRSLLPLLDDPSLPGSEHVFASLASENGPDPSGACQAVRDDRYKVVRCDSGTARFHDLRGRDDDGPNLLDRTLGRVEQARFEALDAALATWRDELTYLGD